MSNGVDEAQVRKAAIVAITLEMIVSPGPFQLIFPNVPSIGDGGYANALTPVFVVPSSILLHALSLRQLIRRSAG
jgi:hypothetical protein